MDTLRRDDLDFVLRHACKPGVLYVGLVDVDRLRELSVS